MTNSLTPDKRGKITIDEATNECDSDKATFIVPWAGKLLDCCEEHAKQLRVLGNVIGSPVDVRPIVTNGLCYQSKEGNKK